ncbi:helix-turn-helix transcriptional regulator [Paenibacillus paeoniae]|uniref:XRE family transcriptional regulator n=1 Tax=Paenibacillus paeoniae TaxID=2292705 RepID=A0A371P0A0_9BACL|nr:XRE family transcriptional regulator [Paenibacillus paeoniae]
MPLIRGRCRLRDYLGDMSPAQLARRLGVNESTVSRWISRERDMTYEHAVEVANVLNCHAEDLYDFEYVAPKDPSDE